MIILSKRLRNVATQEAISKKGFWFKIEAGPRFKPEEYLSIWRI